MYCIEVKSTGRIPILKLNDGLEVAKFFLISYLINKFDFLFSKIIENNQLKELLPLKTESKPSPISGSTAERVIYYFCLN